MARSAASARRPKLLFLRARRDRRHDLAQQGSHVELRDDQIETPGLDSGKIQDVVDQRQKRLAGASDRARVAPLLDRQFSLQQQTVHAQHAVEWRTDLVAHRSEELRLGLVRCLCRCFGTSQFTFRGCDVSQNTDRPAVSGASFDHVNHPSVRQLVLEVSRLRWARSDMRLCFHSSVLAKPRCTGAIAKAVASTSASNGTPTEITGLTQGSISTYRAFQQRPCPESRRAGSRPPSRPAPDP